MSLSLYALLAVCVMLASFVQSVIGVGFALILVPVVAFMRPDLLPVFVLLLMLPLNAYVLWREHEALDWPGIGWISLGRLAGTFAGLAVLLIASTTTLSVLISLSTLCAVALSFARPALEPGRAVFAVAGLVTGISETATGVGGPPLALVFQNRPSAVLRSSVAACFLTGQIGSLLLLVWNGYGGWNDLVLASLFLPSVLIGSLAGHQFYNRLPHGQIKHAVLAFAAISSIVLLLKNL